MTKLCFGAAFTCVLACEPCKDLPGGDDVEVDGVELYEYHYPSTGESVRIFHDGAGAVHLVHIDDEGERRSDGQAHATLTLEALAILDAAASEIASGTQLGAFDPWCLGFVDAPVATLFIEVSQARLQFRYPGNCPPSLLTALDQMCRDLVLELPTCEDSPLFRDCQITD